MRSLLIASSLFLSLSAAAHAELAGAAVIISGDTIEVQGQRVRFYGVIAPGLDQLCTSARAQWRCGMVARLKLEQRIGSSSVICREQGADRHGRILGRCRVDDGQATELNRWLVISGWALASGDHGQAYKEAEAQAVSSGAGLWRDGFEPSADWRRLAESAEREPGDGVVDCSSCTLRHRALDPGGVAEKPESVAAIARAADPAELTQAWEQAWLHLPGTEAPGSQPPIVGPFGSAYVQERLKSLPRRVVWPTVVFLHGCTGIQAPERRIAGMLTHMGYAVILPNSQARSHRPSDCDVGTGEWGLAPIVHYFRRAELSDAMSRVRKLPWVDLSNLFLGGFGEGAKAVALWGGQEDVAAYLITGWTCIAPPGLEWLGGLRLPAGRPVLAIVTRGDPYYRHIEPKGSCGGLVAGRRDVTSLVIDGSVHNVFVYPETWLLLVEFMLAHTRSALVPSQAFRAQGLRISVGLDDGQPPIFGSPPLRSEDGIGVLRR